MKTNNYFFKAVLLAFCLNLAVMPKVQAMQQYKSYQRITKKHKVSRCVAYTSTAAFLMLYPIYRMGRFLTCCLGLHTTPEPFCGFIGDMPTVSCFTLGTLIALKSSQAMQQFEQEGKEKFEKLHNHLQQNPDSIAELNQEQIKTIFEQTVNENNIQLMGFLLPHIPNPYIFLNEMLAIAKDLKHGAAIKLLVDEIRKQVKPKIDNDMYALGINLPKGIPELITDYIAYAKPAAPQAANEDPEQD
jgi:hypothetical protein